MMGLFCRGDGNKDCQRSPKQRLKELTTMEREALLHQLRKQQHAGLRSIIETLGLLCSSCRQPHV